MGKILEEISAFLIKNDAQAISPIPAPVANQRGPSCGFYSLAYVLTYWHERCKTYGGNYATQEPLPPRTHAAKPKSAPSNPEEKAKKLQAAKAKNYSSLRHFGKYNKLTLFGSVFDAGDLVKIAKGESSQYAGQFDGKVISLNSADKFSSLIKQMLDWECPVIVPFDVSEKKETLGEPVSKGGDAAHWVVIIGHYKVQEVDFVVYFNWGKFYTAKLQDFAVSNAQLTSNSYTTLAKYDIKMKSRTTQKDTLLFSDYADAEYIAKKVARRQIRADERFPGRRIISSNRIGGEVHDPGFNDPTAGGSRSEGLTDQMDGRKRMVVGGLRNRVVVVYRVEDSDDITGALKGF